MTLPSGSKLRAVVFDYGNTLIEFSRQQIDHCDGALGAAVKRLFGDFDPAAFNAIREENRMAPYHNGYRENQLPELTRDAVERLFGRAATQAEIDELVEVRFRAFVECISAEDTTHEVLAALGARYQLGLLSNYPCGRCIRASLTATKLDRHLAATVVSGDVGYVKPHPKPYSAVLDALGVAADETVFVGDNWLADVQGSKRAGMSCIHMRRWVPPERFDPEEGDHQPDAVIDHLQGLVPQLLDLDPALERQSY